MSIKRLDHSGFTLMEIMAVIMILVSVAAIAFVKFDKSAERMRAAEAVQILQVLKEAQEVYKQENGAYTAVITGLGVSIPPVAFFDAPTVSDADVTALATIARKSSNFSFGTAYTLKIPQTGAVTCSGSSYCTSLGF